MIEDIALGLLTHLSSQQINCNLTMLPRYVIRVDPDIAALLPPKYDLQSIDVVYLLGFAFLRRRGLAAEMVKPGVHDGLRDVGAW